MIRCMPAALVLVLISGATISGCGGAAVGGGGGGGGQLIVLGCAQGSDNPPAASDAVAATNTQRAMSGVGQLFASPTLSQIAQTYAERMGTLGFTGHEDAVTGERVGDRITAADYGWTLAAENLGYGQCSAEQIVEEWMASSAHRENFLRGDLTEIGIGVYQGGDEGMYWVQVLATPAN